MNTPDKRGASLVFRWLPAIGVAIVALGFWQLLTIWLRIPSFLLPSPWVILKELAQQQMRLLDNAAYTILEAVSGFVIATAVAFFTASSFMFSRFAEKAIYPWAIVLNTLPIIAIAPLLTLWLGYGLLPKIVIAAIVSYFPMLVNTVRGLRAVNLQTVELLNLWSASPWQIFRYLRVPSSLPYVFAGLKITSTLSVIGAIVGEFTGADKGIGFVIMSAGYNVNAKLLFAAIVYSSLAALIFFGVIVLLEQLVLSWPGAKGVE